MRLAMNKRRTRVIIIIVSNSGSKKEGVKEAAHHLFQLSARAGSGDANNNDVVGIEIRRGLEYVDDDDDSTLLESAVA